MSSPRIGIFTSIRFDLGENWQLECVRLTNQNFWLDGSRASYLVHLATLLLKVRSFDFSVSQSPFGLDFGTLDFGTSVRESFKKPGNSNQ